MLADAIEHVVVNLCEPGIVPVWETATVASTFGGCTLAVEISSDCGSA